MSFLLSESRNYQIMKFLRENEWSRFNEIERHLESENLGYANTKGLAKKLDMLEKKKRIKRKALKPYPLYNVIEKPDLSFAIAGDNFGSSELPGFNWEAWDLHLNQKDSDETNITKIIVNRFGFYVLTALLKNLDYWIKKTGGRKNELRKVWLKQALDLSKYQDQIIDGFLYLLTNHEVTDDTLQTNIEIVKKRINKLKKSMKESYPDSYTRLIHNYENAWEWDKTFADRLVEDPKYSEYIPKV